MSDSRSLEALLRSLASASALTRSAAISFCRVRSLSAKLFCMSSSSRCLAIMAALMPSAARSAASCSASTTTWHSLTVAVSSTLMAREPNSSVEIVSLVLSMAGLRQMSSVVLLLPPTLSCRMRVSFESR